MKRQPMMGQLEPWVDKEPSGPPASLSPSGEIAELRAQLRSAHARIAHLERCEMILGKVEEACSLIEEAAASAAWEELSLKLEFLSLDLRCLAAEAGPPADKAKAPR